MLKNNNLTADQRAGRMVKIYAIGAVALYAFLSNCDSLKKSWDDAFQCEKHQNLKNTVKDSADYKL